MEEANKGDNKEEDNKVVMMEEEIQVAIRKGQEEAMKNGDTSGKQLESISQGKEERVNNMLRDRPNRGEGKNKVSNEKENIPPKGTRRMKGEPGSKEKGKRVMTGEEDEPKNAMIVYKSPSLPKIIDFLAETWEVRSERMETKGNNNGF